VCVFVFALFAEKCPKTQQNGQEVNARKRHPLVLALALAFCRLSLFPEGEGLSLSPWPLDVNVNNY
jgi:hypothetical protein